jgi:type VI secretion system protein ImpH
MATARRGDAAAVTAISKPPGKARLPIVSARLFEEPFTFSFFQAVRLLERLNPRRASVGRTARPETEAVRFRTHVSLAYPASEIYDLSRPPGNVPPVMTVTFMGLAGFMGVLPDHYTELLLRLERDSKNPEKHALRDWFDLFNHRLISLFFRAWEKYRFQIPYERGQFADREPDAFTRCLFSFIGLEAQLQRHPFHGVEKSPLRDRLRVSQWDQTRSQPRERVLARIDDLTLLYYSGYLAHRPRCAAALQALLQDYFGLPIAIKQFQGQWLHIESASQSRLGDCNGDLGINLVAGERVWDAQSKFRVRVGPLNYAQFLELLPDRTPIPQRKAFFLLSHLIRLYAGPEFDFDIQLILRAKDVPACRMGGDDPVGPRLGWNTWMLSGAMPHDVDDVSFLGEALVWVDGEPSLAT